MKELKHSRTALNGDFIVQDLVSKIITDNEIETVIETGTHTGLSTAFFSENIKNVITTEINSEWLAQAKNSLNGRNNIQFFKGDSAEVLQQELPKLKGQKVFFFLDAHFNNDLALDRELQTIKNSNVIPYIMIHDFKVPSRPDLGYDSWDGKDYSFENLKDLISPIYPDGFDYEYNEGSPRSQRGCILIKPKRPIKKVIYTAMFGGYDDVHEPSIELNGWDMKFFTDQPISSNRWDVIKAEPIKGFDNVQMSRRYKILPHLNLEDYDVSIWVDASILIKKPINDLLKNLDDSPFAIYSHVCDWKTEFDIMGKYYSRDRYLLNQQLEDYQADGFDINSKIMSGNLILRKHNDDSVKCAMDLWWNQFNKYYIRRDQISLAYSLWKSKLNYKLIDGLYPRGARNEYFTSISHNKTTRLK